MIYLGRDLQKSSGTTSYLRHRELQGQIRLLRALFSQLPKNLPRIELPQPSQQLNSVLTHCENCFFPFNFWGGKFWLGLFAAFCGAPTRKVCLFSTLTGWQRTIRSLQSLTLLLRLNKPNPTHRLSSLHAPLPSWSPSPACLYLFFVCRRPKLDTLSQILLHQ